MPEENLAHVHLMWCIDILKRIRDILDRDDDAEQKIQQIDWLVKQALKVERED